AAQKVGKSSVDLDSGDFATGNNNCLWSLSDSVSLAAGWVRAASSVICQISACMPRICDNPDGVVSRVIDNRSTGGEWERCVAIDGIVGDVPILAASQHFDRRPREVVDDFVAANRDAVCALKTDTRTGHDKVRTVDDVTTNCDIMVVARSA